MIPGDLFTSVAVPSDLLAELDDKQHAAATAPDGSVLVRAGAGTGKTRTLVARIQHLIRDRKVAPWEIMAVTFTRKAAREIRERVALVMGESVAAALSIGTFHGLSAKIVRRNAPILGMRKDFEILSEDDVMNRLRAAIRSIEAYPAGLSLEDTERAIGLQAERAMAHIQSWKSWGLSIAAVEDRNRARRSDEEELYARIYSAYQTEMQMYDKVDFGDLILKVIELFEKHPEEAQAERDRVRHLLIDEAQDANPAQVRWARWMSSGYRNVFAVGDEDQSIFSFQGGYPGALLDLTGPDAARVGLTINRRCTDEILEPAVKLVGWNRRSGKKELRSGVSGAPVGFRTASNEKEEATWLATSIRSELEAGTHPSQIAVLVRAGWVTQPIEEALLKAGIPYDLIGGVPLLKRKEIQVVLAYLRLAMSPYDVDALEKIHDEPTRGVGTAAMAAVRALVLRRHVPVHQACRDLVELEGVEIKGAMREGLDALALQLSSLAEDFVGHASTKALLDYVLVAEGVGYRRFLAAKSKAGAKRIENIKVLERVAADFPDLLEFLDEISLGRDDEHADPNKVRVSTMHSSKGLEWDVVYCPALEMDVTPNRRAIEEVASGSPSDPWNGPRGGGMDEERRLVHVAFTRARRQLHLSCSLSRGGRLSTPSPFLPESGIDPMLAVDAGHQRPVKKSGRGKPAARAGRKGFSSMGSVYD